MTRTLWEWVWHFPTCPGMQNPWQWHKGWWLSIARKECKVTMACRLSWHWQIFAGVSKVRWYCLYGMICRKEMFGSDTLISFSFSAQVYLTCRIHTVKWQDIRGFKWKQKKIGQRKVNTEYLAYLSWKKKNGRRKDIKSAIKSIWYLNHFREMKFHSFLKRQNWS